MCLQNPTSTPLAVTDPNAGIIQAEAERAARAKATGFSKTLKSTDESRKTGSAASKVLFGQ